MATKQQKVDKILRLAKQVGEQVDLPRQALLQAQSQDLDFLITTLQSRVPQARQQMVMVQAQARVPQGVKKQQKKAKAPGKKLMNYMKFRAMAMKKGLTEAQTKRAYATYKQVGNAQQAVAKHVTPSAQQRAQQRMQQRQQAPVQRKPAKAPSKKPKAAKPEAAKRTKTPKSIAQRAAALSRAIAQGKIAARQGKTSPSDYTSGTARQKAERFVSLYKGARAKGIKRSPQQRAGLKSVYQSIRQQGKKPYYLSKGYTVTIKAGGGPGGPGIIRKLPGYPGRPFSELSRAEQQEVIRFLNTEAGKKLRAKGAKSKKASLQKLLAQAAA